MSEAAYVDTTAPVITALSFGEQRESPSGDVFLEYVPSTATLTVKWSVTEPHTAVVASAVTLWAGGTEAAVVPLGDPREGRYTFAVFGPFGSPLQLGTSYRVELRTQGYIRAGADV